MFELIFCVCVTDGLVVMECEEPVTRRATGQIVMDYLTDTVVSHKVTLLGQPYLTPDSRIVVTVHRERTSVTLTVQHTTGNTQQFPFKKKINNEIIID